MSTEDEKTIYAFETFRLDTTKRLLLARSDEEVPLMPKAFDILHYLVLHSGQVVDKDDLMSAVWQDRIVEENNLTQNISALRRALGEKHRENRFIATVPGRGYKFVAKVQQVHRKVERIEATNGNSPSRLMVALSPAWRRLEGGLSRRER